jgi:hypothetical protein
LETPNREARPVRITGAKKSSSGETSIENRAETTAMFTTSAGIRRRMRRA